MSEPIQSIAQNNYILQSPPPTATMFTTELEYDGDKISGYAGSAFKAGTDLEFGYTDADTISSINNSAITDVSLNNIVQTNSGAWGGSALPISAGPGIDVQLENDKLVFSAIPNETVIYTGVYDTTTTSIVCDEPLTSFENVKVLWQHQNKTCDWSEYPTTLNQWYKNLGRSDNGTSLVSFFTIWNTNNNEAHFYNSWYFHVPTGTMTWTFGATGLNEVKPIKVVGINRIGG
jgi:hypothetical protein